MQLFEPLLALRLFRRNNTALKWLPMALLLGAVLSVVAFGIDLFGLRSKLLATATNIPPCLIVGMAFGLLPVFICLVQTVTRKRLLGKLDSVQSYPVARTIHYMTARSSIDSISPATLDADYVMPFLVLFLLYAFGFALVYGLYPDESAFGTRNLILGGLQVLDPHMMPEGRRGYQAGTFVMMSMAFIGSYIYMIGRLIERLSNNDLYPISLYFYVVRAVIAIIVAAVLRHTADSFDMQKVGGGDWHTSSWLLLLAFIVGLAPDLFLLAMARKAFQGVKVMGNKKDPPSETRPTALPLIMLDDITRDKVDRLTELGIDSAQVLACQNPFTIWLRLPYDLSLVVEWVAAAQLYTLVKEITLLELRKLGILTVFDLRCRLEDADAAGQVCARIGLPPSAAGALKAQLDGDPCFVRLQEVRSAMVDTRMLTRTVMHPRAGAIHGPRAVVDAAAQAADGETLGLAHA